MSEGNKVTTLENEHEKTDLENNGEIRLHTRIKDYTMQQKLENDPHQTLRVIKLLQWCRWKEAKMIEAKRESDTLGVPY